MTSNSYSNNKLHKKSKRHSYFLKKIRKFTNKLSSESGAQWWNSNIVCQLLDDMWLACASSACGIRLASTMHLLPRLIFAYSGILTRFMTQLQFGTFSHFFNQLLCWFNYLEHYETIPSNNLIKIRRKHSNLAMVYREL